jgi:hypothetical protein
MQRIGGETVSNQRHVAIIMVTTIVIKSNIRTYIRGYLLWWAICCYEKLSMTSACLETMSIIAVKCSGKSLVTWAMKTDVVPDYKAVLGLNINYYSNRVTLTLLIWCDDTLAWAGCLRRTCSRVTARYHHQESVGNSATEAQLERR